MLVTGVQAAGARSVTAIQGAAVDTRVVARAGDDGTLDDDETAAARVKAGESQPVVFPRAGIAMDQRPVAMRHEHAAARYRSAGGDTDPDDAA